MASAAGFLLMTWCVHKRGPVFTAAFIPIVQIMVAVIDFFFLHEQLYLGRYCACIYVWVQLYVLSIHASAIYVRAWRSLNLSLSKNSKNSVLGSVLMIFGLYLLLWGKKVDAAAACCSTDSKHQADGEEADINNNKEQLVVWNHKDHYCLCDCVSEYVCSLIFFSSFSSPFPVSDYLIVTVMMNMEHRTVQVCILETLSYYILFWRLEILQF